MASPANLSSNGSRNVAESSHVHEVSDPARLTKILVAVTIGVVVACLTVSIRLVDPCFDDEDAVVLGYAIVRSILFYLIPSLAVSCFLLDSMRSKRLGRLTGTCTEFFKLLFSKHMEIVGMIFLGCVAIAGNTWRMYVFAECIRVHPEDLEPDSGVGRALRAVEVIFTLFESIFIISTILITIVWAYSRKQNGQRATAEELQEFSAEHVQYSDSDMSCVWLLGYEIASILILLVSSAADEAVQETTFSAHRKCKSAASNSTCSHIIQKNAAWSKSVFSPLALQFCFVTLIVLVKLWIKLAGKVSRTKRRQRTPAGNRQTMQTGQCWFSIVAGLVVGLFCVSFYIYRIFSVDIEEPLSAPVHHTALGMSLKATSRGPESTSLSFSAVQGQTSAPNFIQSLSTDSTLLLTTPAPLSWSLIDEFEKFVDFKLCVQLISIMVSLPMLVLLYRTKATEENKSNSTPTINDFVVILTSTAVSVHCVFYLLANSICLRKEDKCGSTEDLIVLEQGDLAIDVFQAFFQAWALVKLERLRHVIKGTARLGNDLELQLLPGTLICQSLLNLSIWLADCLFELKESRISGLYLLGSSVYPRESWMFLTQLYYPVGVYFRFHSCVIFLKRFWSTLRTKGSSATPQQEAENLDQTDTVAS